MDLPALGPLLCQEGILGCRPPWRMGNMWGRAPRKAKPGSDDSDLWEIICVCCSLPQGLGGSVTGFELSPQQVSEWAWHFSVSKSCLSTFLPLLRECDLI